MICSPGDRPKLALVQGSLSRGPSAETEGDDSEHRRLTRSTDTEDESRKPLETLVSYVDEITAGGRKNSKGQYTDIVRNFPGFGKKKPRRDPPDCFPQHCHKRYSTHINSIIVVQILVLFYIKFQVVEVNQMYEHQMLQQIYTISLNDFSCSRHACL